MVGRTVRSCYCIRYWFTSVSCSSVFWYRKPIIIPLVLRLAPCVCLPACLLLSSILHQNQNHHHSLVIERDCNVTFNAIIIIIIIKYRNLSIYLYYSPRYLSFTLLVVNSRHGSAHCSYRCEFKGCKKN